MVIDEECLANAYQNIFDFFMTEGMDEEMLKKFHYTFKGQQISFPMRLYDSELTAKKIQKRCLSGEELDVRELTEQYGFSTRWVQKTLKNTEM